MRMTLSLRGVTNVKVSESLCATAEAMVSTSMAANRNTRRKISIRDVLCDNHYRQGISVISVDGLLVENSAFNNTWGTPPCGRGYRAG